ncbi:unnamed protein product, partial [Ectocarpus fasciculatus]
MKHQAPALNGEGPLAPPLRNLRRNAVQFFYSSLPNKKGKKVSVGGRRRNSNCLFSGSPDLFRPCIGAIFLQLLVLNIWRPLPATCCARQSHRPLFLATNSAAHQDQRRVWVFLLLGPRSPPNI